MNTIDVSKFPVCRVKCKSCPFGENGDPHVRRTVEARLLSVSQTCHSSGLIHGRPDTHICRGARDHQLLIMYRLGAIEAPTDEAGSGISIYAVGDTETENTEPRNVRILATGEEIPEGFEHIGSIVLPAMKAIHIFMEPEQE